MKLAYIGGVIFGMAIEPLGEGSGFPSKVWMAIAFYVLFRKQAHDFLWKLKQYKDT